MKTKHGLILFEVTRRRYNEGFSSATSAEDRESAWLRGTILTENITTHVEFQLVEDEVRDFNALETKIAQRFANELLHQGR